MVAMSMICGVIFGLGLAISGMVNPAKVLAFLDVAGDWDPSLALVMGAALVPSFVAFRWLPSRPRPWLADRFELPAATVIDGRLLGGAALFGIGWGLVGLCPGPAIAALAYLKIESLIFLAALVGGIGLARLVPPAS